MAHREYDHAKIEGDAQDKWARLNLYETDVADESKEPYYLLIEFPYPSGDLHIGHWFAFAVTDIYARMMRMRGKNVLFPIGFDSFGLPAENAAIKNGADPAKWTMANIERMRSQLRSMGASFDWSKEVIASDPSYYHWTQWLFAKLFEHELAERRQAPVKWCPKDQTVLANEQVIDGKCERCGTEVEEKLLTQWFLRITQYAERLLTGLEKLPWRDDIKESQRAWIGKSEGARLFFDIRFKKTPSADDWRDDEGNPARITVFTTRPDTLFGATYLVLAPEHPWLAAALAREDVLDNAAEVGAYVQGTKKKTERERMEDKEKTGVELKGVTAVNPATHEEIPVYVADYVLGSYGTGAVMAVPAHDERDFEFAQRFGLPLRRVVEPTFVAVGDREDAYRAGEPVVAREAICAVVRNPKDDTYLCIMWKGIEMHGLVTGGIEDGEDIVQTARREVREETGYTDLVQVEHPDMAINTFFYHRVKRQNRHAHFHFVFFELESDAREPVDEAEAALHEVVWKKKEELKDFFTVFEGEYLAQVLEHGAPCYSGPGILTDSGAFSGRKNEEAMWDIALAAGGERTTQYRLRDWLVSRQRYWGCPIPIVYDPEGAPHAVPAEHLPWLLPTDVDFTPTGKSPLASSDELRARVTRLFGEGWTPEYDTLDTFVDSSWYFLRYLDPRDDSRFSDASTMRRWMPVDRYSGGAEHTTMHLLYSRFFYKALYDLDLVPTDEPYEERFNRGLIMGPDGQKMSKRWGNVINPDEYVREYGADAVRAYLAFIGPYNEPGNYPWQLSGVPSMRKFLERVMRLAENAGDVPADEESMRALARAEAKVREDADRFKFNTCLAALMTLMNELEGKAPVSKDVAATVLLLLAPFAPHICEHLWGRLGNQGSVHAAAWPRFDETLLKEDEVEVAVQVSGKRRGAIRLSPDAAEAEAKTAALAVPAVATALAGREPSRIIYVPGKILNLVV